MEAQSRSAEILLIEDNPGDLELIQEALRSGNVMNHISMATDGEAAIELSQSSPRLRKHAASRPDPSRSQPSQKGRLLDPEGGKRTSGVEPHSRGDPDQLPGRPRHSEELQPASESKPVDVDEFLMVVRSTGEFWLSIVRLPPSEGD